MNYMKQVAEMLGLEWDEEKQCSEEFNISNTISNPCKITSKGTFNKFNSPVTCLYAILTGEVQIQKLPWKPKHGEKYYYACIDHVDLYDDSYWSDCKTDILRHKAGLIYHTKEEAIARTDEILRLLGVDADGSAE